MAIIAQNQWLPQRALPWPEAPSRWLLESGHSHEESRWDPGFDWTNLHVCVLLDPPPFHTSQDTFGVFQCGAGLQIRHHLESDPGYLSRWQSYLYSLLYWLVDWGSCPFPGIHVAIISGISPNKSTYVHLSLSRASTLWTCWASVITRRLWLWHGCFSISGTPKPSKTLGALGWCPAPPKKQKKDLTWVKEVTTCLPQLINV